jgi:hypothetical protein
VSIPDSWIFYARRNSGRIAHFVGTAPACSIVRGRHGLFQNWLPIDVFSIIVFISTDFARCGRALPSPGRFAVHVKVFDRPP